MKDNILETARLVSLMATSLKNDVEGYSRAVKEANKTGDHWYADYINERNCTRGAIENKIKTLRYTLSELMREL